MAATRRRYDVRGAALFDTCPALEESDAKVNSDELPSTVACGRQPVSVAGAVRTTNRAARKTIRNNGQRSSWTVRPKGEDMEPQDALARGRDLRAGGFVAIDFETATRSRGSACAIGLAIVQDGAVADVRRWLVRPPDNRYESINVAIHGITPSRTADALGIDAVWPEVADTIGSATVLAHNAAFDMGVIRASLSSAGVPVPHLTYLCTCSLARHAWPGWLSYRLDDVAHRCGVTFKPHEAGDDATAAASLGIAYCGAGSSPSIVEASRVLGVLPNALPPGSSTSSAVSRSPAPFYGSRSYTKFTPTVAALPVDGPLFGRTVLFTGTLDHFSREEAAQHVVDAGGRVAGAMSRKVNYLVCGIQDAALVKDGVHSTKILKAMELRAAGAPIELLSEHDFYQMLHL